MLEYALLVALLSVAMITGVSAVGDSTLETFEVAGKAIEGKSNFPSNQPQPGFN